MGKESTKLESYCSHRREIQRKGFRIIIHKYKYTLNFTGEQIAREKQKKGKAYTEEKIEKTSSDTNGKTKTKDTHMQTQIHTWMHMVCNQPHGVIQPPIRYFQAKKVFSYLLQSWVLESLVLAVFFFLMIKKNFNSSKYTVILVSGVCTIQ